MNASSLKARSPSFSERNFASLSILSFISRKYAATKKTLSGFFTFVPRKILLRRSDKSDRTCGPLKRRFDAAKYARRSTLSHQAAAPLNENLSCAKAKVSAMNRDGVPFCQGAK